MNKTNAKFWIVVYRWEVISQHGTTESATREAERWATEKQDIFYVLEAMSKVGPKVPPVEWEIMI